MNKKVANFLMTLFLVFTLSAPGICGVSAATLDTANVESNITTPTVDMLYDQNYYLQVRVDSVNVIENGVLIGTNNKYVFIPKWQSRGSASIIHMDEFVADNDNAPYVRLYAYFEYNGFTVSCYKTEVEETLTNFTEKSLTISGDKSKKCTVKLSYSFSSMLGTVHQSLKVSCNNIGEEV